VRTEGLCALVRAGLWVAKSFGWIFGPLFLWFISFGGAKEMNNNIKVFYFSSFCIKTKQLKIYL
jgi:hypothetical protein